MKVSSLVLAALSAACGSAVPSPILAANAQSAEAATRSFYSWYVPEAMAARSQPAWAKVLRKKPPVLSARLQRKLATDLEKKAHASGMIQGIDFDPFLGGQDPCPRFTIGKIRMERASYLVDVKPICGRGAEQPPITVFLLQAKSRFVIDDVRYGARNTLQHALEASE